IGASATDFACAADNTVNQSVLTVTIDPLTASEIGTPPYLYSIDGVNFQTGNTFSITDTGVIQNITVTVRDDNSCEATTPVTIDPLPTITDVTVAQDIAITCTNDETVDVTVIGGSGDFTFDLLPLGTAQQTPAAGV